MGGLVRGVGTNDAASTMHEGGNKGSSLGEQWTPRPFVEEMETKMRTKTTKTQVLLHVCMFACHASSIALLDLIFIAKRFPWSLFLLPTAVEFNSVYPRNNRSVLVARTM